jgi:hypothetical protein
MCSIYFFSILPISYIAVKSVFENIKKNHERKSHEILLNHLYTQHLECLHIKGFTIKDEYKSGFNAILNNKDLNELESCKNTYFNFISAYRKYKHF